MIALPDWPGPQDASGTFIDTGGVLRSPFGSATRVNRAGGHYAVTITMPPMEARAGRVWLSRLVRGIREGVEIEFPLLAQLQGVPGAPVVDGAVLDPTPFIAVRGVTPGYAALEGYWLSIEAAGGQQYLHNVGGQVIAGADGRAVIPLSEPLRTDFVDGASVHLARPILQGLVIDDRLSWQLSLARHTSLSFTIEEAG